MDVSYWTVIIWALGVGLALAQAIVSSRAKQREHDSSTENQLKHAAHRRAEMAARIDAIEETIERLLKLDTD